VPRKWTRLGVVVGNNSLLICFYGLQRGRERKEVFFSLFIISVFRLSIINFCALASKANSSQLKVGEKQRAEKIQEKCFALP
jgi:hypothetical protein